MNSLYEKLFLRRLHLHFLFISPVSPPYEDVILLVLSWKQKIIIISLRQSQIWSPYPPSVVVGPQRSTAGPIVLQEGEPSRRIKYIFAQEKKPEQMVTGHARYVNLTRETKCKRYFF
jgi:hypothetical protein